MYHLGIDSFNIKMEVYHGAVLLKSASLIVKNIKYITDATSRLYLVFTLLLIIVKKIKFKLIFSKKENFKLIQKIKRKNNIKYNDILMIRYIIYFYFY